METRPRFRPPAGPAGLTLVSRRGFHFFRDAGSDALLAAIVESSNDAIISKTLNGVVTSWNGGAERLFGFTAAEAIGQPITLIIPPDRLAEEDAILERLRAGERIEHYETLRRTKAGQLVDVSITVSPVRDRKGRVTGASKIARGISPRRQAEAMLREADRRKDEFLAVLSHELRNPLAPLLTAAHLLERGRLSTAELHSVAQLVERQVSRMAHLIDDLLDVSRITAGKIALNRQRVDLARVIEMVLEASRPRIDGRGQSLEVALPAAPIPVDADPQRLAQVFSNLLDNAAKYTDAGGRIWLTAELTGPSVVVRIRDTGIGIAADQLAGIFGLYMQAQDDPAGSRGGLGIGLAVARRLLELHRGTIYASSPGAGQGAEFCVRLPLAEAPAEGAPSRVAAAPRPDIAGARRRILIADDNEDAAVSLALLLRLDGHEVVTASDGAAALAYAEALQPEVMLLDLLLPKLSGYEVARELRRRFPGALLVAITGLGHERHRSESQAAGFDHHLLKPVDTGRLRSLVAGH